MTAGHVGHAADGSVPPSTSSAKPTEMGGNGETYTCPMHPEIKRDAPGQCPICGMALVPEKSQTSGMTGMPGMVGETMPDMTKLAETRVVESYGGRALALPFVDGYSTSALVQKIRQA